MAGRDSPASPGASPSRDEIARRSRLGRLALLSILAMVAVAACAALWFRSLLDGPVARGDFEATVVIARGASYHTIVEQLRAACLLPHPFVFDYLAWRRGDAGRMRPGRYRLRSSMSARAIYEELLRGAPVRITVPEGWTLAEIAARLADKGLLTEADSFLAKAGEADFLAHHQIEGASAEGYLLAETYLFDPGVTAGEILETMAGSFARRYAAEAGTTRPQSLTWHQVVTLASMIEREARNDQEKPSIASVYYNRLGRGMKLDCDATVRYALSKWQEPLTKADLKSTSPYNTYVHPGLPPGPIGSIGYSSLKAVLSPEKTDYLFYCLKDARSHHFSKTLQEHQRAVKKFLRKDLTQGG